jgi:hypothetical protein
MEEDQNNSNLQSNSESSSIEVNTSPQKKDSLLLEQSLEPDKENYVSKDSSIEKKTSSGKGWLLFLVLIITLGTAFYFYSHKNDSDFLTTLSEGLKKLFLNTPKIKNTLDSELEKIPFAKIQEVSKIIKETSSLDTEPDEISARTNKKEKATEESHSSNQSNDLLARPSEREVVYKNNSSDTQIKEIPGLYPGEIIEQKIKKNPFDQIVNENKKSISLLRNEIKSLKSELKTSFSSSQKLLSKSSNINNSTVEEFRQVSQKQEKEPRSKTKTSSKNSLLITMEPLVHVGQLQKISPQRSEEVQAYLDFIENAGGKFVGLIKDGWGHLQVLIINLKKNI